MNDPKKIAIAIKKAAKQKNIQLLKMYEDCGVSKNALNTMNSGKMPSIETIAKFAEYIGVSLDSLVFDTEKEPPDGQLQWYDSKKQPVTLPDEAARLSVLRADQALTERIEEVAREVYAKEALPSNKG